MDAVYQKTRKIINKGDFGMNTNDIFTIYSGESHIEIHSEMGLGNKIKALPFLYQYVPAVRIELRQAGKRNNVDEYRLFIARSNTFYFRLKDRQAFLGGHFDTKSQLQDLVTIIDYFLERVRQAREIYCVHGSAVSRRGKGLLIIGGASGLGKTSLAINLASNYGYKFIGDEKILLGSDLSIVGAVRKISLNKQQMLNYLDKNSAREGLKTLPLLKRNSVPLALVIQPLIAPGARLEIEKWSSQKADFHFYEELSRKIRGVSRRVVNFSIPIDSIDAEPIARKRSEFSKKTAKNIKFYWLKGDMPLVSKQADRLLTV